MASRSSRPLHSKNHSSSSSILPRKLKLSNANGFSAKNTYDDVFAGPPKFGAPIFSSRVDDYAEIFGASRASSIPFLDLSALEETKNVSSDETRSSKLEYSKIFGGFGDDEQVAVYEEMFDERIRRGGKFSEKAQTPAKTVSSSEGSETLNDTKKHQEFPCEASNQSFGGVKQFNMSYQKSGQRSNSGTNGTTHVAQLHSVPGFTHFINENTPLQKTRCDESVPGSKTSINLDKNSSNGVVPGKHDKTRHLTKKQKPEGVVKHKNGLNHDAFYSNDKQFSAYDIGLKTQPSKVSPLSGMFAHKLNPIGASEGSMASNLEVPKTNTSKGGAGDCSPTFSDEDVDVNSAAAASAVALRKAIQRAQESIRIAKETMERKKDGLQSSTKPISKSSLDVKERKDNKVAGEVKRTKEKNAKGMCERVDAVLQVFAGMERQNVMRSGKVAPEFHDSEETFIGREVMNKVESADECDAQRRTPELENSNKHRTASFPFMQAKSTNNIIYSVGTDECESTGTKTSKLILGNQEENVRRAIEQSCEEKDMEKKLKVKMSEEWEEHGNILKSTQEVQEVVKSEKTVVLEDEETEEKQKAFDEQEKLEKNWKGILEQEQNEKTWIDDHEKEENGNPPEEVLKQNEIEKLLQKGCEWQNCESKLKQVCEVGSKEEQNDISKGEDNEKRLDKLYELQLEIDKTIPSDPHDRKESEEVVKEDCEWEGNEMTHIKAYKYEETASIQIETEYAEYNVETEMTQEAVTDEKIPDGYKRDANESLSEKLEANIHDDHCNIAEVSQEVIAHEENEKIRNFHDTFWEYNDDDEKELEAVKATYEPEMKETFLMAGLAESAAKHIDIENTMENATEAFFVNGNLADFGRIDSSFGQTLIGQKEKDIELASNLENGMFEHDSEENQSQGSEAEVAFDQEEEKNNLESTRVEKQWTKIGEKAEASQQPNVFEGVKKTMEVEEEIKTSQNTGSNEENSTMEEDETKGIVEKESVDAEIAFDQEEDKSNVERAHEEKHWIVMGKKIEVSRPPSVFQAEEKTMELDEEFKTSDNVEENEENLDITYTVEEKETEATAQREVTVEKELLQKIDEAKRREREREKERIAVERAIREARERAFAEARERAERAAVERATAEARQRITADAREKFEKASLRTKTSAEKASIEAKLRAERAAVERATAEARDRALEKALSQKSTSGEREKGGNFGAERFSGASRDNGTSSTDDSQRVDRANTESALGHKARLESHQRIMERAAKALAEKNRRDILAQKEQAERNRLAATLDADVKRWSSGKEGNLRALLSTLQYILEPKSGWQPVSLTDIITTNAVKKAYRKATLCVHPDKLQQRGATIPQKYICEKVFDLLKAAWNKFDSEER